MQSGYRLVVASAGALVLCAALSSSAGGVRGAKAPDAPAMKVSPSAAADLKSSDPAKIRGALDEIRMAGKGPGTPFAGAIIALLERGAPAPIAEAALDTLGDLEAQAASPVAAQYMQHRNVRIRQAATRALIKTKGPVAVRALRHGLSDPDPMVRGVAANGLGTLKAKEAVPDLFLALDHHINEAAVSIGVLCNPAECEKLASLIGKFPFDVMSGGIEQAIFRADVSDDTKIKLLGRVRELGTRDANKFLSESLKKWPKGGSARVRQALDQAVQATAGGS